MQSLEVSTHPQLKIQASHILCWLNPCMRTFLQEGKVTKPCLSRSPLFKPPMWVRGLHYFCVLSFKAQLLSPKYIWICVSSWVVLFVVKDEKPCIFLLSLFREWLICLWFKMRLQLSVHILSSKEEEGDRKRLRHMILSFKKNSHYLQNDPPPSLPLGKIWSCGSPFCWEAWFSVQVSMCSVRSQRFGSQNKGIIGT